MNLLTLPFRRMYSVAFAFGLTAFGPVQTAFADSLQNAVTQSLLNSNARNASIAAIEAQEKQVIITQSDRKPRVEIFAEVAQERIDDPNNLTVGDNDEFKLARGGGATVTYSLLDGMRSLNTLYREATLLDSEIIRLSDATETLALNAVQSYIDVVRHQNIAALSQQNIVVHERIVGQVEQQVTAGKLSEPDRFRANDKLLAAKLARSDAQAALADAIAQYELVIGVAPRGSMSIHGAVNLPGSRATLETNALTNSLQLKLARNDLKALTYQGAIDEADWKPRVDLFASADAGIDRGGSSDSDSRTAAGVRLNWTLHSQSKKSATIARNRDLQMRAHYQMKQLESEVRDFARRTWNQFRAVSERKALLDRTVSTNVRIVEEFRREFEAAKRPLLQVLDAERALFNQKVQRINAEANLAFQKYKILAAQNTLADHFGLAHAGRALEADFEQRVKSSPRGEFNVTVPPLE